MNITVEVEFEHVPTNTVYTFRIPIVYTPGAPARRCADRNAAEFGVPAGESDWYLDPGGTIESDCPGHLAPEILNSREFRDKLGREADSAYRDR